MLTRSIITALALSLGLAAPVAVSAAGEISAKEYKVRKEALLAGSSQTAKTEPK
jgi:ABC-type nickel/cobalt efflux system permease component RcnA